MQEGSGEAILFLSMIPSGFLLSFHLFSKTTDNESEKTTYTGRNHETVHMKYTVLAHGKAQHSTVYVLEI